MQPLPHLLLPQSLLSLAAFEHLLRGFSVESPSILLADIHIPRTVALRIRSSRRREYRVLPLLRCSRLHKRLLRHTAPLFLVARLAFRRRPQGLALAHSFRRDGSDGLLALPVSAQHGHRERRLGQPCGPAHHLGLYLVRNLARHVLARLEGALAPTATLFPLLLPLHAAILELLIEALHLGEVCVLEFIKSLDLAALLRFHLHLDGWHQRPERLGLASLAAGLLRRLAGLFSAFVDGLLARLFAVAVPVGVAPVCRRVGLLQDGLVAVDFPLKFLLDVLHSALVMHLCDDRRGRARR